MKKLILVAAMLLAGTAAEAQNWMDALKKAATTAIDEATGGKLTEMALVGTWNYTEPGIKFEGEDIASSLAGAALETKASEYLAKAYTTVGIRAGVCSIEFDKEKNFILKTGSRVLNGTYEYAPDTHALVLHFTKGRYDIGTMEGRAYISGTELQVVFPVTKLVNMVTEIGSQISALSTVSRLLQKYENVYIGFAFNK